jgi:hypothetical protein
MCVVQVKFVRQVQVEDIWRNGPAHPVTTRFEQEVYVVHQGVEGFRRRSKGQQGRESKRRRGHPGNPGKASVRCYFQCLPENGRILPDHAQPDQSGGGNEKTGLDEQIHIRLFKPAAASPKPSRPKNPRPEPVPNRRRSSPSRNGKKRRKLHPPRLDALTSSTATSNNER